MKFAILWHQAALFAFYRLPLHTATLVDRATVLFAETGEGRLEWVAPYHRLRAGKHELVIAIDREKRVFTVLGIYRSR
jgi:hypothetical protein